jgi:hypothetical protein
MHRSTTLPATSPRAVRAGELTKSTVQDGGALRCAVVSRDTAGAGALWPGSAFTELPALTAAEAPQRVVHLNTYECSYASLPGRPCEP